jgi:uncharacterized SAM-dependent methyltransferase
MGLSKQAKLPLNCHFESIGTSLLTRIADIALPAQFFTNIEAKCLENQSSELKKAVK